MVSSFRRGAVAAVLVLALAPLAAACSAGNDAQTDEIHPNSFSGSAGDAKVQSAFVLTDPSGPATVSARLFNNGSSAQTLESVRIDGAGSAQLLGANGASAITVPAHGSVLLGGAGNPAAILSGAGEALRDGDVQSAVFTFSGAGAVRTAVSVTPAAGYFEPYGPGSAPTTPAPAPSATTPAATAKATATSTVTPTATATPTS